MSKEKPIIFNIEMVKAILADRKTKTRRLNGLKEINENPNIWTLRKMGILGYYAKKSAQGKFGAYFETEKLMPRTLNICPVVCPWEVGDVLWVRETWNGIRLGNKTEYWYKAGNEFEDSADEKWRSPRYMPKVAARLFLEVKDIQVERVQDITEEDARAEGVIPFPKDPEGDCWADGLYRTAFQYMWNKINGWNPNAFELNPWDWAVAFERVEKK